MSNIRPERPGRLADELRFVPFAPAHLAALDLRPDIAAASPGITDPASAAALAEGLVISAACGMRTICCGGVVEIWAGVWQAWLAPTNGVRRRHWPAITQMVGKLFHEARFNGAVRIQTVVREDFAAGHRWAERLGLAPEGLMPRWGPDGRDYRMYAWVKPRPAENKGSS